MLSTMKIYAQEIYRDTFSSESYTNNDGTLNWSSNWIEVNDNNNPNTGFIEVTGNRLEFHWLIVGTEYIARIADLSNATSAILSFDWQTLSLDGNGGNQKRFSIQVSNNGGASYTTIASFSGTNTGTFSQDISAFISNNTVIRFIGTNRDWDNDDFAYIDNVQIAANYNSIVSANNITVNESDGTATFDVRYTGNTISPFSIDYNTLEDSAKEDTDYISNSGTLNFTGTSGEVSTVTINLVDNTYLESDERFFLTFSNPSNTSIASNYGIATIIDDNTDTVIPENVPLTLFDQFNGYMDYSTAGGTLRTSDTDQCAITTSSTGSLTSAIPGTATIEKAYLLWAHSDLNPDTEVTFEGQTITADVINKATFGAVPRREFYGMISDVTTIIEGIADPTTNVYDFSDLRIDNTNNDVSYCANGTVLGAWGLMIFYSDPSLPASSIRMYNGFDPQQNTTTSYTLDGFFAIGATGSKTTVLSWEGDQGLANNESLSVTTGSGTFALSGDGDNNGGTINNPFNSTIYDNTQSPVINNTGIYGIDFDTFDVASFVSTGDNSITTNVGVGQDLAILNSVLLKVPGNLIVGTVFEDINYPGGSGRNLTNSNGIPLEGVTVELYDNTNTLIETQITDASGEYVFGGMDNGDYTVRVVNSTVTSSRGGGSACTTCLAVQTYRTNYAGGTLTEITNEIGGTDPAAEDTGIGVPTNAQSVSTVTILNDGAVDLNFGFNFNTIVNTNPTGQGSLAQFIINTNNLEETGLDIEANSIFNPAAGEDTSIFMIPPTSDILGRTADLNFTNGYFDINLPDASPLSIITDDNTHIDGRTQTAYSGDTNSGTVGAGGTTVGISATILPSYDLPQIQVRSDFGDVIQMQGSNTVIQAIAIYGGNRSAIRQNSGTNNTVIENLLGVNAQGVVGTVGGVSYVDDGIEIIGGSIIIDGNYISSNTDFGVLVNGGSSTTIQNNHFTGNGYRACNNNIRTRSGSNILIQNNLIENSEAAGIRDNAGSVTITENTITTSGVNSSGGCTEISGIRLFRNNTSVTNNIIYSNAGAGIVIAGNTTSGNLISQNSIYANGTVSPALGIDINDDGVTLNDNGDTDAGPNESLNFPVFEAITASGNTIKIVGWSRPGATIEFFITDITVGTASAGDNQLGLSQDYGEGQVYIATAVEGSGDDTDTTVSAYSDADGNTDNTNKFSFTINLSSPISIGSVLTATATIGNSTSEFANTFSVGTATVITNRRITYRVKPN